MWARFYCLNYFALWQGGVDVRINVNTVFYWLNPRGGITMMSGEDKIISYNENFFGSPMHDSGGEKHLFKQWYKNQQSLQCLRRWP